MLPTYRLMNWWSEFKYNFGWHNYVNFLNGWLAKSALAMPVIGYLILFNDAVARHLSFDVLTSSSLGFLSTSARLKFSYIGLVLLGSANALYYLRRPHVIKIGKDEFEYVDRALQHFTLSDYIRIHGEIRHYGHFTQHGKYYDSEYDAFLDHASPRDDVARAKFHWIDAKAKFEGLLRSMLIETFFRGAIQNRKALSICLALASMGYLLLVVPSLDLFARVMCAILIPITK